MIEIVLTWGEIVYIMLAYIVGSFARGFGFGLGRWLKNRRKDDKEV